MNWLLKNEKDQLKILIDQTIKNGLSYEIDQIEGKPVDLNDPIHLHNTILDFLIFLEDTLLDCLEEQELDNKSREKLKLSVQKLNPQKVDLKTIWLSMQETKDQIHKIEKDKRPPLKDDDLKNTLLGKLIKNWKPQNNEPVN